MYNTTRIYERWIIVTYFISYLRQYNMNELIDKVMTNSFSLNFKIYMGIRTNRMVSGFGYYKHPDE